MALNVKDVVLEATEYRSGFVNKDDDYVISASMIGKEPLQNYLSIIHGKIHDDAINDATLGSVFHAGMETIMTNKQREQLSATNESDIMGIEESMFVRLANGWILSGTADLILGVPENGEYEIHDYKLSKSYALKMLKKDLLKHDYTKQLHTLDALIRNNEGPSGKVENIKSMKLVIDFFAKDAKAINYEPTHTEVVVPGKHGTMSLESDQELFREVVEITNVLQQYIESGTIPPICEDRWPRNIKGVTTPIKCALYCSHGKQGLCPHYQNNERTNRNMIINW